MVSNDEARRASNSSLNENNQGETYGATGKSAFLFLMGSDIVIDRLGFFFLKKKQKNRTDRVGEAVANEGRDVKGWRKNLIL